MSRTCPIVKRVFDIAFAAMLLAMLAVPMAIIYILVRMGTPGPGLYRQARAGAAGRTFTMLKFRTMRSDHVHDPDPSIVITDADPDVTRIGAFLRRSKLDELPQLVNVLAGQMSLVGPRPTVPEQVGDYSEFQRRRLDVAPGITGLAQVNGDTALTWPERIEWDVYYVDHRSFRMDLAILIRTGLVLLRGPSRRVRRLAEVHPAAAGERPPHREA